MAISFTTLTGTKTVDGSIKNWVNDSTIPAGDILTEAQAFIYERLRVREMLAVNASFQFDSGSSSEPLPADFIDPLHFMPHGWGHPLPFVHEEALRAPRDEDGDLFEGTPARWTILGTTAHVDVACDADFAGTLMYYARPAALSGANETNFLTVRYPTLLRRAAMAYAFEFKKDNIRASAEIALAEGAIAQANASNEMFRRTQLYPA